MDYKQGKAWGFLAIAAVSVVPAIVWLRLGGYLAATACESGCDQPEWARRQFWIAVAAIVAWLLAMLAGWLDRLWPLLAFGGLAFLFALAWLLALAAV